VWSIVTLLTVTGAMLQVVGHRVFERRQPALLDNPTHLLLGPMFVMANYSLHLVFGTTLLWLSSQFRRQLLSALRSTSRNVRASRTPHP